MMGGMCKRVRSACRHHPHTQHNARPTSKSQGCSAWSTMTSKPRTWKHRQSNPSERSNGLHAYERVSE